MRLLNEIRAQLVFGKKAAAELGRYVQCDIGTAKPISADHCARRTTQMVKANCPRIAAAIRSLALTLALAAGNVAARADDLCGCWEGYWKGCTDGLTGTVKAKITKCGENRYRAVFWGRAFKIMPYRYESILIGETDAETGEVRFRVTQKLPIWGCYWMNGSANGCTFFARYHTDDHVGYFKMTRVCCK